MRDEKHFRILDVIPSCVTNEEGDALRQHIQPYLEDSNALLVLNFEQCHTITSSFYNSFLGQLIEELGLDALRGRFRFTNLHAAQRQYLSEYFESYERKFSENAVPA